MTNAVTEKPNFVFHPGGKDTVFAAGDYFTKNGHLYFVLDYTTGGFVIENCQTFCSLPVTYEYMREGVRWLARDSSYKRTKSGRGE